MTEYYDQIIYALLNCQLSCEIGFKQPNKLCIVGVGVWKYTIESTTIWSLYSHPHLYRIRYHDLSHLRVPPPPLTPRNNICTPRQQQQPQIVSFGAHTNHQRYVRLCSCAARTHASCMIYVFSSHMMWLVAAVFDVRNEVDANNATHYDAISTGCMVVWCLSMGYMAHLDEYLRDEVLFHHRNVVDAVEEIGKERCTLLYKGGGRQRRSANGSNAFSIGGSLELEKVDDVHISAYSKSRYLTHSFL